MDHRDLVFNVVWTGETFTHLQVFAASVLAHSTVRLRFVGNQCPPAQLDAMERFAAAHPGRVVEVFDLGTTRMVRHGDALDAVRRVRDDGEFFGLLDPDILARGPFLDRFTALAADHDIVTSGREVWTESNVRADDQLGINGEVFFDTDGYVFGSPHFSIYRRAALDEVTERWNVGFATAGDAEFSPEVGRRLEELGRRFWIYDTGKIVNILMQGDGHPIVHEESPDLIHIGGVAHFLAPPMTPEGEEPVVGENVPDWYRWDGMAARYAVAQHVAGVIEATIAGRVPDPLPDGLPGEVHERLAALAGAVEAVAREHGPGSGRYASVDA